MINKLEFDGETNYMRKIIINRKKALAACAVKVLIESKRIKP